MQPLIWMSLGAVIGWASGRALQDGGYDWFRDVVMGIGGVVVGGLLGISDGFGGYRGSVITTMATVAAVLLVVLVKRASGHMSYGWLVQGNRLERVAASRSRATFTRDLNGPKLRFVWSAR